MHAFRPETSLKAVISIPYVSWRGGRPRFEPGPGVRALGFEGEDLRHGAPDRNGRRDGAWFTLQECEAWAETRAQAVRDARERVRQGLQPARAPAGAGARPAANFKPTYNGARLFADLWKSQRFNVPQAEGGLAPRTIEDYQNKARLLLAFDPDFASDPAEALTPGLARALHEKLWKAKGLSMANAMIRVLSIAYTDAVHRDRGGLKVNPCLNLGLAASPVRLRIGLPAEIAALMQAADEIEPEIGDAILMGLYTAQRQGDALHLEERRVDERNKIRFIQGKTGARVIVPAMPQLLARLAEARSRKDVRQQAGARTVVVDPRSGEPYKGRWFNDRYRAVRSRAMEICPSVASFNYQDLRDTAVTRLSLASCTIIEIASITGHSLQSIHSIMKHYLELAEAHADIAIDKVVAWMDKEGIEL
jgi:integrase